MKRHEWDKLRNQVYYEAGHVCQICGAKGKLNCHEVWEYDDKKFIQKLKGFIALCSICHNVKHFGFSGILAAKVQLDLEVIINHFCKVNNVSRKVFSTHKTQVFNVWRERSKHQWKADLDKWSDIVAPKTT